MTRPQQEWHGPIRLTTTPQDRDATPYIRRGRVLLGLMGASPRKVEVQEDGAVITVLERFKGEKQIHVALPQPALPRQEFIGTWLSPTSTDAPNGYTGADPLPTIARRKPWDQPDSAALHSLSYYPKPGGPPTADIRRFRQFNTTIGTGDVREFVGSSSNRQAISWDNAPTKHNTHLDGPGFGSTHSTPEGEGRNYDLGRVLTLEISPGDFVFAKVAGTDYDAPDFLWAAHGLHWNCLFYKGKVVPLPDAPFQQAFFPLNVPYLDAPIFNVRIGGAFFREGRVCYIRSLPFFSQVAAPSDRLVDEEIVFVYATYTEEVLTINGDARPIATATLPDSGSDDKFTWADWVFSDDGSEVVSMKYGTPTGGVYWRLSIDWDDEVVTGGLLSSPDLIRLDWSRDGQLLKLKAVSDNDPANPVNTFTLPTGAIVLATSVVFNDLRHDTYIFQDFTIDEVADTTTLRYRLYSSGQEAVIYNEVRAGTIGTSVGFNGNFTDPVLVNEDADGFTLVAVSCQIAPGNGWPERVYNSNQQFLEWAGVADKPAPALNPILRG